MIAVVQRVKEASVTADGQIVGQIVGQVGPGLLALVAVHRTDTEGSDPTDMGYNAFNRVAQPEDRVPLEGLTPRVGAFDVFAARWGYANIPGADTPEAEQAVLGQWIDAAQETPWLRYTRQEGTFGDIDPCVNDQPIGVSRARDRRLGQGLAVLLRLLAFAARHGALAYDERIPVASTDPHDAIGERSPGNRAAVGGEAGDVLELGVGGAAG